MKSGEVREIIDADVDCRLESVRHASDPKHVILHTEWIRQGIQAAVSNGRELWLHREYFPSLQFSPGVESNLVALPSEALHCVVRVLFLLNSYRLDWHEGERFAPEKIGCPVSLNLGKPWKSIQMKEPFRAEMEKDACSVGTLNPESGVFISTQPLAPGNCTLAMSENIFLQSSSVSIPQIHRQEKFSDCL